MAGWARPTTTATTAFCSRTTSRPSGGGRCSPTATTSSPWIRRSSSTRGCGRPAGTWPASPTRWWTARRVGSASAPTSSRTPAARRSRRSCPARGPTASSPTPREFNLMFETNVGPVRDTASAAYLRPETAQGIFINFKNVLQFARKKPPFGIAQVGKSFRNEITPGNFVFRTREFEQMEMEYFVPPDQAQHWFEHWTEARFEWYVDLGIRRDFLRLRPHDSRRALPLLLRHLRRRVPVPHRLVRARGDRQPGRLRPQTARRVLRREARVLRPVRAASATSRT